MAKFLTAKMDMSQFRAQADKLNAAGVESLARRMVVSGGVILRDEARINARVTHAKTSWIPNPNGSSASSQSPGTLAEAIYLSRDDKNTTQTTFTYKVSWNNALAWWGRLREFGYMMQYAVYKDAQGMFHTNKKVKLAQPRPYPAHPILAPAYDQNIERVRVAMIERGREEIPKLLSGGGSSDVV